MNQDILKRKLRAGIVGGSQGSFYVCMGFLLTGLVLLAIGFTLGPIARWSRHAELPPSEVTPTAVQNDPNVTARRV